MLFLSGVLFISGYNIMPANFGDIPLDLSKDATKLRADAWNFAVESGEVTPLSGGQLERGTKYGQVQLVYEGDNVFTRENLLSIKHYEETLFNRSSYRTEICLLHGTAKHPTLQAPANPTLQGTPNGPQQGTGNPTLKGTPNPTQQGTANLTLQGTANPTIQGTANPTLQGTANPTLQGTANRTQQGTANRICAKPLSILRFFDGTYAAINSTLYDPNFENIAGVLYTASMNKKSNALLNFHLGKDARISPTEVSSPYTRSLFFTGWPLKGYKSNTDRQDDQKKELDKKVVEIFWDSFDEKYNDGVGEMNFYYFSVSLWTAALQKQIIYDMMLAVASLCFIFSFCWFQTGSLWITSWGIFGIFSSFNITNLLYRIVLDYRYFGVFHVMSIFIILGIGSDNIFVFMDSWKQSENNKYKSLAHRLSDVYRKSAKTMFVTSITTIVAFLSNAPSPLLSISSFGIFSAVLIFVNYLTAILFFPTVVMYHHESRKGRCWCCALYCSHQNPDNDLLEGSVRESSRRKKKTILEYVIEFFDGWFFRNIVTHKYVRWFVLVVSAVIIGVAISFATQLEPDREQTQVWRSDTNWATFRHLSNNAFKKSQEDHAVVVSIIWGLKEQDRSECHHSDFKCKGKTVFDRSFDLNPPPCQTAMLDLCKELKAPSHAQENTLKLRRNEVTGEVEIKCVFERMDEYLKEEAKKSKYPNGSDFSFVINANKMQNMMYYNPDLYNVSLLSDSYYRYFEIGLGYFITDGGSKKYATTYDFKKYQSLLGGVMDPTLSRTASNNTYLQGNTYGHRLAYVAITVNTTLNPSSLGYEEGLPIYRDWEDFVNNKMKTFPSSCNNAFQATVTHSFNVWHWVKVQQVRIYIYRFRSSKQCIT
ncbi:dispatched homolog 3-like [Paramuricea clavata]|uniref:Dispatched homolog 3-like n=1 Tax=Paramuricea clavata TaxID=317549 RepID=A0A6S7I1B5_PARCT|nr:dispatched homolog 3-like [Paramuricea clavata]